MSGGDPTGTVKLSPSLMCADVLDLRRELDIFSEMKIDYLHVDIMDGHYVPNLTLGPGYCMAVGDYSPIPLDIHLMIENVDAFVPAFTGSENSLVSFHPEAVYHPLRTVQLIKDHGARAGIAIDPATPIEAIKHILPDVEMVCVMTVSPGYSGQRLIPQALDKLAELSSYIHERGLSIEVEVDGNVSWENIPRMTAAGANVLVLGTSSIYDGRLGLRENIVKLKQELR